MSSSEKCLLESIHSCTWLEKGFSGLPHYIISMSTLNLQRKCSKPLAIRKIQSNTHFHKFKLYFTVLYVVIVLKWTVHNNSTQFPPCYTPHPSLFVSLHPTHPLHPWTSAMIRISQRETKKWRIPVTFLNCCRHKQLSNSMYWPFTLWNMHNSNR